MKRVIMAIGLTAMLVQSALAWRPAGWQWFVRYGSSDPYALYAYCQNESNWYYFDPNGGAWVCNMDTGTWWKLKNSSLRNGWSDWSWPWAYCTANGSWYYVDTGSTHWVASMGSGQWSRLGEQASSPTAQQHEARAHQLINNYRVSNGRPALSYSSTIADIARVHSQNMANGSVAFGHDGFDPGRVNQIRNYMSINAWAENVAYNYDSDPPYRAYIQWINSSGHNANILNGIYNYTGIGAARRSDGAWFFTQIFVRRY